MIKRVIISLFLIFAFESVECFSAKSIFNPLSWFRLKDNPEDKFIDAELSTPEIAVRYGYQAETHTVKTEDGYLLSLHRLPCGRNMCEGNSTKQRRQPVFIQHGLLGSSADFILNGPERALAFILADKGYDVWLGNARGNTYSRKHVNLSVECSEFWNFSWDEMAFYDIPAEIDYIYYIRETESNSVEIKMNLLYIGHSMGTTMLFAMLSAKPEYNKKIQAAFTLAPVAYMTNVKSPIRVLAPYSNDIEFIMKLFGANDFLPQNKIIKFLSTYGCEIMAVEKYFCENILFVLCGFDRGEYNSTVMPVIFRHTPAGTSTKTVLHFAQEIKAGGSFQYFDLGKKENLIKYGQPNPPMYNITNISTPIALLYSENDWLAGPQDVNLLYEKIKNTTISLFKVPYPSFNHIDFIWGIDAPKLVYKPMIKLMQNYN